MHFKTLFGAGVVASLLGSAAAVAATPAPQLPRKSILGLAAAPLTPELQQRVKRTDGVLASRVTPGLTAGKMGLAEGDIILTLNSHPMARPADVVGAAAAINSGDTVRMTILRDGKQKSLQGKAIERPKESYTGAVISYGAVAIDGGLVRDILVKPEKPAAGQPIVFILQGFTCASVDYIDPDDSHRRLIQRLVDRGIGAYRVEKPGVGDSRSPRHCLDMDFDGEIAAFRAAYKNLPTAYGIQPDQTFLLGHSLGGLEAPILAAETPPRGVAAYGTVLRNWMDYYLDVIRFQGTYFGRGDPVQFVELGESLRPMLEEFFVGRKSFKDLAAANPDYARDLREVLGWDGGDRLLGRHYSFWHDLAALPLAAAWRDTRSRVLSLYGESDLVALNDEDHRLIALIVNHFRPGTAKFVQIAGAEHDMRQVGNPDQVRSAMRATRAPPRGPFEPAVAEALIHWVDDSMAAPPVRTMTFEAAPSG